MAFCIDIFISIFFCSSSSLLASLSTIEILHWNNAFPVVVWLLGVDPVLWVVEWRVEEVVYEMADLTNSPQRWPQRTPTREVAHFLFGCQAMDIPAAFMAWTNFGVVVAAN